jgi:hypothetical protein
MIAVLFTVHTFKFYKRTDAQQMRKKWRKNEETKNLPVDVSYVHRPSDWLQ